MDRLAARIGKVSFQVCVRNENQVGFAESIQDDPILAGFKTSAEFPRGEAWVRNTLERVLKGSRAR